MPFAVWYWLCRVVGPGLFVVVAGTFFLQGAVFVWVQQVAVWLFAVLCLTGAFFGVLMCFGRLRMACPFCGRKGVPGGSKADGLYLDCEACGTVRRKNVWNPRLESDLQRGEAQRAKWRERGMRDAER